MLNHKDEYDPRFQTKKGYIISNRNNGQYGGEGDKKESTLKTNTEVVKPFSVDYADEYILVTGNITVTGGNNNTKAAFKNCHPFIRPEIHLNDEYVETADNLQ